MKKQDLFEYRLFSSVFILNRTQISGTNQKSRVDVGPLMCQLLLLTPGLHIVVTIAELATEGVPKRVLKLSAH